MTAEQISNAIKAAIAEKKQQHPEAAAALDELQDVLEGQGIVIAD